VEKRGVQVCRQLKGACYIENAFFGLSYSSSANFQLLFQRIRRRIASACTIAGLGVNSIFALYIGVRNPGAPQRFGEHEGEYAWYRILG